MRKPLSAGVLLFLLPMLFARFAPAAVEKQFFVSTYGYDGNSGETVADAFGSVTRVVQALYSAQSADVTLKVILAPGQYPTDLVNLSNINAPTAVTFFGDTVDEYSRGYSGPVWLVGGETQSSAVRIQNSCRITFTGVSFTLHGNVARKIFEIHDSQKINFKQCEWAAANNSDGVFIDPGSSEIVIDACVLSQTAIAVRAYQCCDLKLQNSWIKDNQNGVVFDNVRDCALINNSIVTQSECGVDLRGACTGSVMFNNVILSNGIQLKADYSPLQDSTNFSPSWRSAYNMIAGSGGDFAKLSLEEGIKTISNLKAWIQNTGQDAWGKSLSYNFPTYPSNPSPRIEYSSGFGVMNYQGFAVPSTDYFGNNRPLGSAPRPDLSCVEQAETGLAYLHHILLTPSAPKALPGQDITVAASLRDAGNSVMTYPTNTKFYIYLQNGGPADVDPLGRFMSVSGAALAVTANPGLYQITGPVTGGFTFKVKRDAPGNVATHFPVRVVAWDDWFSNVINTYGGIADDGATTLQWTESLDPAQSSVTSVSPVRVSGYGSTLTIQVKDAAGNFIQGLSQSDFNFTVSGGTYTLTEVCEDASQPGKYTLRMQSAEIGIRTLTVTALGVTLDVHPQVEFLPGVYGRVTDQDGNGIGGIHVALYDAAGTLAGSVDTYSYGSYSIVISAKESAVYTLIAEDPQGRYPRMSYTVTIPADSAVRQEITLTGKAPSIASHAFPNPARRGQNITLVYDLPTTDYFQLELFDVKGRRIGRLAEGSGQAGRGQIIWRGVNNSQQELAPGVYLLSLKQGDRHATSKVVIVP